jgi:hypothetical protein
MPPERGSSSFGGYPVGVKVEVHEQGGAKQCPYCKGDLAEGPLRACPSCATEYHTDCAAETTTCAVLGCGGLVAPPLRSCTKCQRGIRPFESSWACRGCTTCYHLECAQEVNQCISPMCGVRMFTGDTSGSSSPATDGALDVAAMPALLFAISIVVAILVREPRVAFAGCMLAISWYRHAARGSRSSGGR